MAPTPQPATDPHDEPTRRVLEYATACRSLRGPGVVMEGGAWTLCAPSVGFGIHAARRRMIRTKKEKLASRSLLPLSNNLKVEDTGNPAAYLRLLSLHPAYSTFHVWANAS